MYMFRRQLGSLLQVRVLNYCHHFARLEINKRSRLASDCQAHPAAFSYVDT